MSIATPSTTPAFLFTIKGYIEPAAGELYLVCSDNSRFRIGQPLLEYSTEIRLWQVIPSTDSTGLISNVSVVDSKPLSGPDQQQQDSCQIVGRVVQLGKRYQFVQFKVTRPGEKTLKLTFLNRNSPSFFLDKAGRALYNTTICGTRRTFAHKAVLQCLRKNIGETCVPV